MNLYYPQQSTVNVSGAAYEYNNLITLSPIQMQSGIYAAQMRQEDSERKGHNEQRGIDPDLSEYVSTMGSLCEVAFYVGVGDVLATPYRISYGECGHPDFTVNLWDGDIKGSAQYNNLLVSDRHLHEQWLYVHVRQLSQEQYRLVGWTTGETILSHPEWKGNPGKRGPCRIVPHSFLRPFKRFIGNKLDKELRTGDNRYGR